MYSKVTLGSYKIKNIIRMRRKYKTFMVVTSAIDRVEISRNHHRMLFDVLIFRDKSP